MPAPTAVTRARPANLLPTRPAGTTHPRACSHLGAIAMLDKQSDQWTTTHRRNAAVQTGFHTVDTVDGESDQVERALGRIEGAMATALRNIDSGRWPPNENDRRAIAEFLGLQVVRGPTSARAFSGSMTTSDGRWPGRRPQPVLESAKPRVRTLTEGARA